ncbi:hypothetical protein NDU88_002547 [Pleurodeles waltl]|uniref:Uncharacterized protein n=1 Tax=Pleurodeles waltl TaxID=8319 RepID=A0AAV7UYT7_PLEWA|nr:hypothetical protein NDU88_002547 [Pleurodeles waltl]
MKNLRRSPLNCSKIPPMLQMPERERSRVKMMRAWTCVKQNQRTLAMAGSEKNGITTVVETANTDSHISTLTATAVATNTAAVTANRQAEDNVPPTPLQPANPPGFLGGTNAIKSMAETVFGRETTHRSTLTEEPGRHGARAAGPADADVSAHIPGTSNTAATTTVSTAPSAPGRGGGKRE